MAESPDLGLITAAESPPTGPETVCPADPAPGTGELPARPADAPVSAVADPPPAVGSHTLQTGLLGLLTVADGAACAAELEELFRRAYRAAWHQYEAWCHGLGRDPLAGDPDTIGMYVVRLADAGRTVSSIRVHLAAIKTAHLLAGLSLDLRHPRLATVIEGVTRAKGVRLWRKAAPAVPGVLRPMLATRPGPEQPLGARDRAMLLLGFCAALCRSELVALALGDLETVPGRGLLLTVTACAAERNRKRKECDLAHTSPEIKRILKHSRPDRNAEAKAYGTRVCRSFLASKTARSLL